MPSTKRTFSGVVGGILGLVGLSAVAGLLVTATVTPAIALGGYTASGAITMFENIPSTLEVDQPMLPTTIYATDSEGNERELATFYDQNRVPVEYDEVAPVMFDAILSSEDPRYYEHGGVDLIGTTRALLSNTQGGGTQGGSSVSQQYVKNVQIQECEWNAESSEELSACYTDATSSEGVDGYQRKLQEMRYAIAIEKRYTKEEILIGYLNIANFGGQTYGIEAAAKRYFNTTVSDLTVSQASILAGIVQNPNRYRIDLDGGSATDRDGNRINGTEDGFASTKSRQRYVLHRMLVDGKISQATYDAAYDKPIEEDRNIQTTQQGCQQAGDSAYFCKYVQETILQDEAFGETADERRETLRRGGLSIYTSLDPDIQATAVDSMKANAPASIDGMSFGAAAVTLEADTGRVLAMTQNTRFDESSAAENNPAATSLVYAADRAHGSSSGFNVGSTYKLFTLIDWLEKGRSINENLNGVQRTFDNFTACGSPLGVSTNTRNFGGAGGYVGTPARFTENSLNTGFYAMAEQLDLCDINRAAERMGVSLGDGGSVTEQNLPYGTVLGSKNIAPIDMATAYATVANNGVRCDQRAIDRVVDPNGQELDLPDTKCEKVLEPEVAATAAHVLRGVMTRGTGTQANPGGGVPVLGKTGTHESDQTFMVESSTKATTAVWVGNSTGKESLQARGLQNIRYFVARDIQGAANAKLGGDAFPEPDRELTRVVMADVPNVSGMTIDEARSALRNAGFGTRVGSSVPGSHPEGRVQSTSPSGSAPRGSQITLNPSDGNGVSVPNVSGQSVSDAIGGLRAAGLNVSLGACEQNDGAGDGRAGDTDPDAGSIVSTGAQVTLSYSAEDCGGGDGGNGSNGNNGNGNGNNGNGNGNNDDEDD